MSADFDTAAARYDDAFTHSATGTLQREKVRRFFNDFFNSKSHGSLLEINCGTGEDALWLAGRGFDVKATDISTAMINVAKRKAQGQNPEFRIADINKVHYYYSKSEFDVVFSNFGGLNCLAPMQLQQFFKNISELLADNGSLALVIMPKNTLWEQLYFFLKADFGNMYRRRRKSVLANVEGEKVLTFYYNPSDIIRMANPSFRKIKVRPVGFFLPPSYLESFFRKRPFILRVLNAAEGLIAKLNFLSPFSDHYFIVLQK